MVTDRLIDEFGDRVDRDAIARIALEEVKLFDRAKVRDFVVVVAWRLARDRVAQDLLRSSQDQLRTLMRIAEPDVLSRGRGTS